jgi:hypothetical protein
MNRSRLEMGILLIALILAGQAVPAAAEPALARRTWVSGVGSDSNSCSLLDPCATFTRALEQTQAGGEINVLESPTPFFSRLARDFTGELGVVNIKKSITIDGGSSFAPILGLSPFAIHVEAGVHDRVTLRNLSLNGQRTGNHGITFAKGGVLRIENCVISNFLQWGIRFHPDTDNVVAALYVENTTITGNGLNADGTSNTDGGGIHIMPQGNAQLRVFLNQIRVEHNRDGTTVDGSNGNPSGFAGAFVSIGVTAHQTTAVGNNLNGFTAISPDKKTPVGMTLDRIIAANNLGAGIQANGANATILIGGSSLTRNGTGVSAVGTGAKTISFGDNNIGGNSTDGSVGSTVPHQ